MATPYEEYPDPVTETSPGDWKRLDAVDTYLTMLNDPDHFLDETDPDQQETSP